jgi:hypothetical protein
MFVSLYPSYTSAMMNGRSGMTAGDTGERDERAGRQRAEGPARTPRARRAGGLHQPEPVAVVWDDRRRQPAAFIWRGRRFTVTRLVELWIIETGWWNDETRVSRSYCRVEAAGRLFDLYYDRLGKSWSLERVLN